MNLEAIPTKLKDVLLLKPKVFSDQRGFFLEAYNKRVFAELGIVHDFVQDNYSRSRRNVLRGLHYQIRRPQGKLVRVVIGEVFDVCLDIRADSPTFGQWVAEILSAENRHMLWLPPGFAHGFLVLSEWVEFEYKVTDFYVPEDERTIQWNDPDLAIPWPLSESPQLSPKDQQGVPLRRAEVYHGMR